MYLCNVCGSKSGYLDGDSRCPKHGLTSFHIEPLGGLSCSRCAEKAQRCQVCGCYVNAKEYNEKQMEKRNAGIQRIVEDAPTENKELP